MQWMCGSWPGGGGKSKYATVLQRQARGTATRKMMRQASAKSPGGPSAPSGAGGSPAGSVGGSPQPGRSPQKARAPQSAPAPSDRKPVFRLLPLPNELAKLDAKLKARQRAILFGGVSVEPVVKMSVVEW